jgi:hypothetical protein
MRRDMAVLIMTAGLGLSCLSCRCPAGQECVDKASLMQAAACPDGQECMVPPKSIGEQIDGCDATGAREGAALVKVKITLENDASGVCSAEVKPERVCVMQGGAIRWKIRNACASPEDVVRITGVDWLECGQQITGLERDEALKNQLFCGVPDDKALGEYAYAVEFEEGKGADPWIEVRRGG